MHVRNGDPVSRGIYLVLDDLGSHPGVRAKIEGQARAFSDAGHPCEVLESSGLPGTLGAIVRRLPFLEGRGRWHRDVEKLNPDFLYIRKPVLSRQFVHKLSRLKRSNRNIRVILELPTFPYDDELSSLQVLPLLLKDKSGRRRLDGVVDRIATLTGDRTIFGVPTLRFTNGIDLDSVPLAPGVRDRGSQIVVTAVAKVTRAHGYDLAIRGLANYYRAGGRRAIKLNIVGDGAEVVHLRRLTSELGLQDHVAFLGFLTGEELEKVYRESDIGLVGLGYHRIGLSEVASLKSREYLARGLPVVSAPLDIFARNKERFYLEIEPGEDPLDVNRLVSFYDSLYDDTRHPGDLRLEVRNFAEKTVTMAGSMRQVIEYLDDPLRR